MKNANLDFLRDFASNLEEITTADATRPAQPPSELTVGQALLEIANMAAELEDVAVTMDNAIENPAYDILPNCLEDAHRLVHEIVRYYYSAVPRVKRLLEEQAQ